MNTEEMQPPEKTEDSLALGRLHPATLRAAWWALRSARRTRRLVDRLGLDAALAPPAPPPLPAGAGRGVRAVLRRRGESCLVRSIVLQSWEAAHGSSRDLIVGVTSAGDFQAHAWLDGDATPDQPDFAELLRRPAPSAPTSPPGVPPSRPGA